MELCQIVLPIIGTFAFGILLTLFMHVIDERNYIMWFKKNDKNKVEEKVEESVNEVNESAEQEETKTEPVVEWIWVTGYKATEKDMKCRDYQYELGVQHDMPDDADIKECESGFHLCLKLKDVFDYYKVGCGNRFFEVRALVRKDHYERYGLYTEEYCRHLKDNNNYTRYFSFNGNKKYDKLVARSIVFERELTPDEILGGDDDINKWDEKYKLLALEYSISWASKRMNVDELVTMGYSEAFAQCIIDAKKYTIAKAVASQPDLSMDMKCWLIFK